MERKKQFLTKSEAKLKAASFCAYQERSQREVRNKLYDYGLYQDEVEDVLTELIMEGFINEERFAKAYAGGKFRVKKWGINKITQGLKQHDLSSYCIKKGLEEIEIEDYWSTIESLVEKKALEIKEQDLFRKREKISRHLISKGFESEKVWPIVKELVV